MRQDTSRQLMHRAIAHSCEQRITQLLEQGARQPQQAIGSHQTKPHQHDVIGCNLTDRHPVLIQRIDDLFEQQRDSDDGKLTDHQASER